MIIKCRENAILKPIASLASGYSKPIDIIKRAKNDVVVSNIINKLRRSARLPRKRTVDDMQVNEEEYRRDNLIKEKRTTLENTQNINIESSKPVALSNIIDKTNNQVLTAAGKSSKYILEGNGVNKTSYVRSLSEVIEDNEMKMKM